MKIIPHILLVCLMICSSGCLTTETVAKARGSTHTKQDGDKTVVVVDEKPEPGYYAVVPFAAIGDVALIPVYVIGFALVKLTGFNG